MNKIIMLYNIKLMLEHPMEASSRAFDYVERAMARLIDNIKKGPIERWADACEIRYMIISEYRLDNNIHPDAVDAVPLEIYAKWQKRVERWERVLLFVRRIK